MTRPFIVLATRAVMAARWSRAPQRRSPTVRRSPASATRCLAPSVHRPGQAGCPAWRKNRVWRDVDFLADGDARYLSPRGRCGNRRAAELLAMACRWRVLASIPRGFLVRALVSPCGACGSRVGPGRGAEAILRATSHIGLELGPGVGECRLGVGRRVVVASRWALWRAAAGGRGARWSRRSIGLGAARRHGRHGG